MEQMQVKQSGKNDDWKVTLYYIVASMGAISLFISAYVFVFIFIVKKLDLNFLLFAAAWVYALPIGALMFTWLGVKFSARWIKKRYLIQDYNKVITRSVVAFIVIISGRQIYAEIFLQLPSLIYSVIMLLIFYFSSKYYLKNSTQVRSESGVSV